MRRLKQNKHIVNMLFIIHSIRLNSITAGMNNSKALINLYISYDEFVSVNNVLREYIEIKEEIKYCETSV